MTLLNDVRLGSQTPRLILRPDGAINHAGNEAVELAESVGLVLDPWQRLTLDVILGERRDGSPAAFEACLICPRQNGKGAILEALELAWLFLHGEKLILHSAHEFRTANEAFLRIANLIDGSSDLRRKVARIRYANGEQGIELRDGRRLKFVARTRGSGRGFSGDKIVLDEAYELDAPAMAALLPTMSARPNPQIVYASSAPMATSTFLHSVRARAMQAINDGDSSGRLAYLEWSADPDDDLTDPATWRKANPALGIRISEEFVASELAVMGENLREFARERLGIPDGQDGATSIIPLDAFHALIDSDSQIVGRVVMGLDVNPERSWASIAACGRRADGLAHVEVVDRRPGTAWIVERAVEVTSRWTCDLRVDGASPAASLIPELRAAGVRVVEVNLNEMARSCGALLDAVVNHRLRHLDQAALTNAVTGARKRSVGEVWAWARTSSAVDITPLVATTLAFGGMNVPSKSAPAVVDPWSIHEA
jgi:phage terminase large subunit-like protein